MATASDLGVVRTEPGTVKCPECAQDVTAVVHVKLTPLAGPADAPYVGVESEIVALEGCEHAAAWKPS